MNKILGKLSIIVLIIILLVSIFANIISPYDPNFQDKENRLSGFTQEHKLGTDPLGRDMLSRVIYGGRSSILIGVLATLVSMTIGSSMGIISGYFGGRLDKFITSITNIFQALPQMAFTIAIAGVLGPGIKNLILALVISSWAGFSRIVRAEVLKVKEEPYIEAMVYLGSSDLSIILFHIIPNIMPNIIILLTTRIGRSLLSIAALSFLGLGVQPPNPDWSVMINDARLYYRSYPYLIVVPGFSIFITILSINTLGDYLRDIFDIRSEEII